MNVVEGQFVKTMHCIDDVECNGELNGGVCVILGNLLSEVY
jgi:hypothetical protein